MGVCIKNVYSYSGCNDGIASLISCKTYHSSRYSIIYLCAKEINDITSTNYLLCTIECTFVSIKYVRLSRPANLLRSLAYGAEVTSHI